MSTPSLYDILDKTGLNEVFSSGKSVAQMRKTLHTFIPLVDPDPPKVASIVDAELAGHDGPRLARVYTPHDAAPEGVLLWFHGGGFIVGDVESYDALCQRLATVSGHVVVSYDYRLAPEHPFPAALDDALAAFDDLKSGALKEHGVPSGKVAVGGDSAGGNLSAVIAQERRGQVAFQLLVYPLMQLVEKTRKPARWQETPILAEPALANIQKSYVTENEDPSNPRISPLYQSDLSKLAPAYILAAELDSLSGEGLAYADRLAAFGVPAERVVFDGVPHGFLQMGRVMSKAKPACEAAAKALSKALSA